MSLRTDSEVAIGDLFSLRVPKQSDPEVSSSTLEVSQLSNVGLCASEDLLTTPFAKRSSGEKNLNVQHVQGFALPGVERHHSAEISRFGIKQIERATQHEIPLYNASS